MKKDAFGITCYCNTAAKGEIYRFTLCGIDDDKVVLELDEKQIKLIASRRERSFYIRCKKDKILQEIDDAGNGKDLEVVVKKYYLCDTCGFEDINLFGVKRMLKVVVDTLYKYPKLRSKLCFMGTHHELEKRLVKMKQGDKEVLNAFNLQYICSEENAKKLGTLIHGILTHIIGRHESYVATAMCAYGLFDAILLDKNDYEGYAYLDFVKKLRINEAEGFHPKGCSSSESVIYHEIGHLLDDMCGLSEDKDFKEFFGSLTSGDIKYGLSEYAFTSVKEFIAEAFAEYMCSPKPRQIAVRTVELLDRAYFSLFA